MDPATITAVLNAALSLTAAGVRAAQAAQAGNVDEARRVLADARAHFDTASDAWDAAATDAAK